MSGTPAGVVQALIGSAGAASLVLWLLSYLRDRRTHAVTSRVAEDTADYQVDEVGMRRLLVVIDRQEKEITHLTATLSSDREYTTQLQARVRQLEGEVSGLRLAASDLEYRCRLLEHSIAALRPETKG